MLTNLTTTGQRYDGLSRSSGYTWTYLQHDESYAGSASDAKNYTHTYAITYEAREGYLEKSNYGYSSNTSFKASTATSQYDAWGRLIAVREHTPKQSDIDDKVRYMSLDGDGMILRRREGTYKNNAFSQTTAEKGKDGVFTYANGNQLAEQSRDGTKLDVFGLYGLRDAGKASKDQQKFIDKQAKSGNRMGAYDQFTQRYSVYGQDSASRIQVQSGDSLQSIAQRAYGNSSLWYVLAAANALSGDADLIAGTQLKVPEMAASKNDATSFRPYNPGEIVGSTSPTLPIPPPSGCGAIGMVIMVIIAIVVTVYTAGAASGLAGSLWSAGITAMGGGSLTLVGAAALGGFVGSVASQAAGSLMGVASFSWRKAVGSGIASGLTAGIAGGISAGGGLGGSTAKLIEGGASFSKIATSAVGNALAGYAGNKIAGVKDNSFSWKAIAANAVTAFVAGKINNQLGTLYDKFSGSNQIIGQTIGGMVSGAVNLNVRRQFGFDDKVDYGMIAADAFGNALGNAVVSSAINKISPTTYDILDEAGYEYSLDKKGKLISGSPSMIGTVNKLVKLGYSNEDLIQYASDPNTQKMFGRVDSINEHLNDSYDLRNANHVHGDNGMIIFPIIDDPAPIYSAINGTITGTIPPEQKPDNYIVNTVNNVITPIAYVAADLHEFAQAHPNSTRALEIALTGASIALFGPVNFVKDKVIDGIVGPYMQQGSNALSAYYNSKGVNDLSSPLAATGTIFAGMFALGSFGTALVQAKKAAQQAHILDVARSERMTDMNASIDSEVGISDVQILDSLGVGARLIRPGPRLKIGSPLIHKNGAGFNLPIGEATNFVDATSTKLAKGTKIYRITDDAGSSNGAYWAFDLPKSKEAWRSDYAVKQPWNDGISYVEYTIPKGGLNVWVGRASSQQASGISNYSLPGGGLQIYVPNSRTVIPATPKTPLNW